MVEISNAALGGPLLIDDNGLNVKVTTPLENTSGTPAITAVDSKLFLVTDHNPKDAIIKAQDELCDDLQRRVRTGDAVTRTFAIDNLTANQFREYNNKLDREAGVKRPMSPRASEEAEKMFAAWFDATAGYGRFENQTRAQVKELIFEHLNEEQIPWSASAVAQAAEYLHKRDVLHRESDVRSGQTGEFNYHGARMIVHPAPKNPVLNPPPQTVEIVERTKKITLQDLRNMSSAQYAEALRNPGLAEQIEALLAD